MQFAPDRESVPSHLSVRRQDPRLYRPSRASASPGLNQCQIGMSSMAVACILINTALTEGVLEKTL
jgi:hypothetical protein